MPQTRTTTKGDIATSSPAIPNLNVEAFKSMMEDIIRDELKPIRADIESLTSKFNNVEATLQDVTRTAEHASTVASEALGKAEAVDKRVSELENVLVKGQSFSNLLILLIASLSGQKGPA